MFHIGNLSNIIQRDRVILSLKETIEAAGLKFEVVESLPVSEDIKLGTAKRDALIENYKTSLKNLADCGIKNQILA